uniref:Uncharacterized protein n=1 Tax=Amphora coffeiformis TaxID=265554 RepID=A0A7S3L357_9STRA|mmetsp:Transcript_6728/g.13869  ORF Transcript_6728/g.13869 Transcript_6728/m.13869 type:complete len:295 (+) Transcript_6728:457-1341(+)
MYPIRYLLQCAYMVPVDLQAGFDFGPSCFYGERMYFLAAVGVVVIMDAEPKAVDLHYTKQAEGGFLTPSYSYIFDKLWYCATNNKNNDNNGKGYLVLKHHINFRRGYKILVMDLSQTNKDVGRGDSKTGIAHRRITPTDTFHAEDGRIRGQILVSDRDSLIFFVGTLDGSLSIESYDMTGHLVASARRVAGVGGIRGAQTSSVVTHDKLVVVYHTEEGNDDVTDYGFGIYVFGCHDLSFCGYTPLFCKYGIYGTRISENWISYRRLGTQNDFALRLTGGNVGQAIALKRCLDYG